jgi:amino acid adenylation domain-containing protein
MLDRRSLPWNETFRDYPLERPITSFLEEQARKTPGLVAVRFEDDEVCYAELNRRANRLARYLVERGVTADSFVGVYMERSIEMVVALVGIIKTGGAYVPFDPEYPADRLAFMFEDSAVPIVVTQHRFEHGAIPANIDRVFLDEKSWQATEELDNKNLPLRSGPETAAYMIYTSGSTGKPKGVINIHKGLVNRILWMQDEYLLTANDRVLQKTPYSFDVSVWEFFWPLITGACIVMAKPGGHRDNGYLIDAIVRYQITTMHFVPSMLNLFINSEGLERISTLRQVMCSGEALPLALTRRFFERLRRTKLHNLYGPTEAAIDVTYWECKADSAKNVVPIGHPIANTQIYILDEAMKPVPVGEEGELHIGGIGLARGYWNRPELTAERFVKNPFAAEPGSRLYKTGDLARYMPDGAIEYLGRLDFQVKLRGFRIELGEIEAVLLKHPGISETVVVTSEDSLEEKQLVAYIVAKNNSRPSVGELRAFLLAGLPEYMVPARFMYLAEMPLLPNGKVNRKALPKDLKERPELAEMLVAARTAVESTLARVWSELLSIKEVGVRDNFFELGGNSLMAIRLAAELRKEFQREVPVVKVFQYPTIEKLAIHLSDDDSGSQKLIEDVFERATRIRIGRFSGDANVDGVAVIGMVGRFPGAPTLDQLWDNLINQVESITRFSPDELGPGIDDEAKNDPNYVPTRGIVTDADKFDASFFGIGPLEAKAMDPQHRIFLELAWAALENAGYDPDRFPGMIGVFAGVGDNHYYTNNVLDHPDLIKTVGKMIVGYGNEKDYIATRASYCLNLRGPSVSANTGCSTSLLAVDHAFKSLIDFECDMALAGGVDVFFPQNSGQLYEEGGTFTRDGHCRPFDEQATGTMFCDGAGIVVLRRLEDAIAAGDRIYAVVRGVAKNNDGANKVSFLAPSVEGQAQVIAMAQAQANIPAETISYIEAHGTGTPLGDPIEVEALTKAFRATTDKTQFCYLGSIKGNIGHPTIASGVAGFIKASLSLYHETIPGTLNFNKPNPKIDFANSPFVVVRDTLPWPRTAQPRRAGVSSFGFGGTNVHAVLEEAPLLEPSGPSRPKQALLLSAKTEAALGRLRKQYIDFLKANPDTDLADMAYTLIVGRRHNAFREAIVAADPAEAVAELGKNAERKTPVRRLANLNPEIVFLFPGQGSQYVNMGRSLYVQEPLFRQDVDNCCDILKPHLDRDLRELLFPEAGDEKTAADSLKDTYYTQPALFTIEYSLAQFWMNLGIVPSALVGHSIGEFVCACLAGLASLEDILPMVALRGRLIRSLPKGSMLSVRCAAREIQDRLPSTIQLAASNSPNLCVVAGHSEAIDAFSQVLDAEGLITSKLHTSHAFHSAMMDPVVDEFVAAMGRVSFSKGKIPILSTCTAEWLTDDIASSPEYWGRHLRMPVLFSDAVSRLLKEPGKVYLEVGPRDVLTTLTRQHVEMDQRERMIASLSGSADDDAEWIALLSAVGRLWSHGVSLDWTAFFGNERRGRIPLPTYPFERTSYWLDPVAHADAPASNALASVVSQQRSAVPTEPDSIGSKPVSDFDPITASLSGELKETLGVALDSQGLDTPFLSLGADSLMLMQLGRTIQSRFGLSVSFRQLVEEYTTPRLLSDAIRAKVTAVDPLQSVPSKNAETAEYSIAGSAEIARLGSDEYGKPAWFLPHPEAQGRFCRIKGPGMVSGSETVYPVADAADDPFAVKGKKDFPLTPSQQEIWFSTLPSNLGLEASCAYNESFSVNLKGLVNDQAIIRALQALADIHEALRGHINSDGTRMILEPSIAVAVHEEDLSQQSRVERDVALRLLRDSEARAQFTLDKGPMFRASVIRLAPDERVVLLCVHRIVCDGWSMDVLLEDFGRLYSAFSGLTPLATLPQHVYSDYAKYRRTASFESKRLASKDYWNRLILDPPRKLELAGHRAHGTRQTFGAVSSSLRLSLSVASSIRSFARTRGLSLFSVMLSAFATLIHNRSSSRDFVIGVPIAGHPDAHMEDAVGPLASVVPFRIRIIEGDSFLEFCRTVQQMILDGHEHSAVSAAELKPDDTLFTIAFSHTHKLTQEKLKFEGCRSDYQLNPRAFEIYELSLNFIESPDTMELLAHANTALYDEGWLKEQLTELERLLQRACITSSSSFPFFAQQTDLSDKSTQADIKIPANRVIADPPIIITLQQGSSRGTPLICLLGIQLYFDLARAIDDGTPVIGIHIPMQHDAHQPPSLNEIAHHYLNAVRSIQPSGPYYLAGLCLGGMVAYEVGQLLQEQGEKVALVVLFDAVLPRGRHIDLLRYLTNNLVSPYRMLCKVIKRIERVVNRAVTFAGSKTSMTTEKSLVELIIGTPGIVSGIERLETAKSALNGDLIAFRAVGEELAPWDIVHPDMGWAATARSVRYFMIDSDHLGIVRPPHSQKVAEIIKQAISKQTET